MDDEAESVHIPITPEAKKFFGRRSLLRFFPDVGLQPAEGCGDNQEAFKPLDVRSPSARFEFLVTTVSGRALLGVEASHPLRSG